MAVSPQAQELVDRLHEVQADIVQIGKNSHGVYVLVGCAILSDLLRKCLQERFTDHSLTLSDRLFEGALSSFSGRIDLSRALGLIGERAASRMHQLRSLRNEFAHTTDVCSLDAPAPAKIYDQLGLEKDAKGERRPRHITALVEELGRPLEALIAEREAERSQSGAKPSDK